MNENEWMNELYRACYVLNGDHSLNSEIPQ